MNQRTPRPRGLTLIEVMVALAIVAITLLAGIQASSALVNNTERLGDTMAAQWCADNQLNEMRLAKQLPSVGDTDFACQQNGQTYRGQLTVRPTPNPNFRRVDARISTPTGVPVLTLSTILARN